MLAWLYVTGALACLWLADEASWNFWDKELQMGLVGSAMVLLLCAAMV